MTGISIRVEITDEEIRSRLSEMVERMDNPIGFYKNVGEHLETSIDNNFDTEIAPDGTPWTPLKASTVRQRMRRGRSGLAILRESGMLKNSINSSASASEVRVGSGALYAAIHQLGGRIDRAARQTTIYQNYNARTDVFDPKFRKASKSNFARDVTVPAHGITIPARPYLGISQADEVAIYQIADDWLNLK